ncbi:uncharacterized protein LY89DRAFT_717139, partial [Mollisia scopiformis]
MAFGEENGAQAACNIPFLRKAVLMESGLTRHVMNNLTAYSQLTELSLRLGLDFHQWNNAAIPLKKLKWMFLIDIAEDGSTTDCWNTATTILNLASTVFPDLEHLDISNCKRKKSDTTTQYICRRVLDDRQTGFLPRLQSFRYQGEVIGDLELESVLEFVRRNGDTLTSLDLAFEFGFLDGIMMDYLLQGVVTAPKLRSLAMPGRYRR